MHAEWRYSWNWEGRRTGRRKSTLNIHQKDWCWSWCSNTLATWCRELTYWKRPWCWERSKAEGEGGSRGWDGWMATLIQWTWTFANSGRWWGTGKPVVLQSMGLWRIRHDLVTEQQQSTGRPTDLLHLMFRKQLTRFGGNCKAQEGRPQAAVERLDDTFMADVRFHSFWVLGPWRGVVNFSHLSRAISYIPLEEPQKIWSEGRWQQITESGARGLPRGRLVKHRPVTDGESEARYSRIRKNASWFLVQESFPALIAMPAGAGFVPGHLGLTALLPDSVTGPHAEEQGHFLVACISPCWLYQRLINIRWHLPSHLTHFLCLVFSPSRDLFFIKILFYLSLSALRWEDIWPNIRMPTTKRPCWLMELGDPLLLGPRWSQKTFKRDIPLLPAFVVFVFLALLSRDGRLDSHPKGRVGRAGNGSRRGCREEILAQEVKLLCPSPPREPVYYRAWPK